MKYTAIVMYNIYILGQCKHFWAKQGQEWKVFRNQRMHVPTTSSFAYSSQFRGKDVISFKARSFDHYQTDSPLLYFLFGMYFTFFKNKPKISLSGVLVIFVQRIQVIHTKDNVEDRGYHQVSTFLRDKNGQ